MSNLIIAAAVRTFTKGTLVMKSEKVGKAALKKIEKIAAKPVAIVKKPQTPAEIAKALTPAAKKAAVVEKKQASKTGRTQHKLFDASVTAVLRALGKAGVTFEQAMIGLAKHKIELHPGTVRAQLIGGVKGRYGELAKITKDQIATFTSIKTESK